MSIVKKLLKARWSSSLIFLILLFLITGLANASFLSYSNIIACFNTATMYTLLAIGIAFVIMTGEIDVSIGAVLGLAASVTGRIAQEGGSIGKMLVCVLLIGAAVGLFNGILLGSVSFLFVGLYIHFFKDKPMGFSFAVSGCIGVSLILAMLISSAVGTLIPLFFKKIKVDPAVASGPLITTVNDLVAVVTY